MSRQSYNRDLSIAKAVVLIRGTLATGKVEQLEGAERCLHTALFLIHRTSLSEEDLEQIFRLDPAVWPDLLNPQKKPGHE
jgi:hypothetical protein